MVWKEVESLDLFQRARTGDQDALDELLRRYRPRISKMVSLRIDPRIRRRVDQSDVVQETFLEVARRLPEYLDTPGSPFFLWIRKIAGHKLIDAHRRHLGAQMRSTDQELSIDQAIRSDASSLCLAQQLVDRIETPSRVATRMESIAALQEALDSMDRADREILILRQFEELTNEEAAQELGIQPAAASKRFVRALQRLQWILEKLGLNRSLL